MMSRKFTNREVILLLVFAIMFVGLFYYLVVWRDYSSTIAASDTTALQDEILIQEAKNATLQQMEDSMSTAKKEVTGQVPSYNNVKAEINVLNDILKDADTYNVTFNEPTVEGSIVRRDIGVTFHAGSYQIMKTMLQSMHDCEYRCMLHDISITIGNSVSSDILTSTDLNVSLTLTFYETTFNADTTEGLPAAETESSTESTAEE